MDSIAFVIFLNVLSLPLQKRMGLLELIAEESWLSRLYARDRVRRATDVSSM